jgi:hypothetical protein
MLIKDSSFLEYEYVSLAKVPAVSEKLAKIVVFFK